MIHKVLKNTNLIAYLCMIIGVILLFVQEANPSNKNQYVLIGGLTFLIIGIYTLAKKLPSKNSKNFEEPLVKKQKNKNE